MDFQQLLSHVKTDLSYVNDPYIDSPFTYLLAKLLNFFSSQIPISLLYLTLVLGLCSLLALMVLKFIQDRLLAVLCVCNILLSIGFLSTIDRGNFWMFTLPILIYNSIHGWDKPRGLFLLTIASCVKPPLILLVFVVIFRTRKHVLFYLFSGTFFILNTISIAVISATLSLPRIFNEVHFYVNNVLDFDLNRIDQGRWLSGSTYYTTNSIANLERYLGVASFNSVVDIILLSACHMVFFSIFINVLYLSYTTVCHIELPLFGVCTILCFYILSVAYILLVFAPFILSLYKEKFELTIERKREQIITWPFLVFLTTVPLSGALLYSGPEYLPFFFPYLVLFKLLFVSVSVWSRKQY